MDVESDVQKIQVKFHTSILKYKVIETPFQIPGNLNRRGLSQIINHLLGFCMFWYFIFLFLPHDLSSDLLCF